jgi:hypothetical protein
LFLSGRFGDFNNKSEPLVGEPDLLLFRFKWRFKSARWRFKE